MSRTFTQLLLLLVFVSIHISVVKAQQIQLEGAIPGELQVRLTPEAADQVSVHQVNGVVQTGIRELDALAQLFNVTEFKRIFRPAGKFEARHRAYGLHQWYRVKFPVTVDLARAIEAFSAARAVLYAGPTYEVRLIGDPEPSFIPDDDLFTNQWHYNNTGQSGGTPDADIDLPEAWDIQVGQPEVVVQLLDTGADVDHPDLVNRFWVNEDEIPGNGVDDDNNGYVDDVHGYNFADNNPNIDDANGHGTHTAGTVAAQTNNTVGVAGVAGGQSDSDGARVMICRVFGNNVAGFEEAFVYGADNGAVISSNSWGFTSPGVFPPALQDAIDYFLDNAGMFPGSPVSNGGLVVFAAGNDDDDGQWYPAFYDRVVAVAATDHNDQKAWYSNFGDWVDIAAPGGDTRFGAEGGVWSTVPGGYAAFQGTSMATPHVAGAAALVASQFLGIDRDALRLVLELSGDDIDAQNPGFEGLLGRRLNVWNALQGLDEDPPAAVSDLAVADPTSSSLTLTWTAPGDDGMDGTASRYEIRYSSSGPIDSTNWDAATVVANPPTPQPAGSPEVFTIGGLDAATTYWFALRAYDEYGNASGVSNSPSGTTLDPPDITVTPTALSDNLITGQTSTHTVTISNDATSPSTLEFSFIDFATMNLLSRPGVVHNDVRWDGPRGKLAKGEPDTRRGKPVVLGAGGPDGFGYQWIDSDESGGPVFDWMDISGVGTPLGLGDDDSEEVSLPFTFEFYGEEKTSVTISSNGYLTFGTDGTDFSNDPIPDSNDPNDVIAPFWDDLSPNNGGEVYYYHDAANNRFIVQYDNVPHFGSGGPYTFQVILYPTGSIVYQYLAMASRTDEATIGIENADGSDGLQIAFNTAYVHDSLAVQITRVPDWFSVDIASGTVDPHSSVTVTATFDATTLIGGLYAFTLNVLSNDPDEPVSPIAVAFDVTGFPEIGVSPDSLRFDTTFVFASSYQLLTLTNVGTDVLDVATISSDNPVFVPDNPGGFSLAVGESQQIMVTFAPDAPGEITGTLTIESNATTQPTVNVPLVGIAVLPPEASVSPDSVSLEAFTGEVVTTTVTLSNTGASPLEFGAQARTMAVSEALEALREQLRNTRPTTNFPRGDAPLSLGPAPQTTVKGGLPPAQLFEALGVMAYGSAFDLSTFQENWGGFDLGTPEDVTYLAQTGAFFPAGDFATGDPEHFYAIDADNFKLVQISVADGSASVVADDFFPMPGHSWTGMADDPSTGMMYASSSDGATSWLYEVDLELGVATPIGEITGAPIIIGIAVDGQGNMYGLDIALDALVAIDKTSGDASVIGSVGFDANFSQGIEWDATTGMLYLAAYNNGAGRGELRVADPNTGATVLVGPFVSPIDPNASVEFSFMGTPGGAAWLSVEPSSGVVPPGESLEVTLIADATELEEGLYDGEVLFTTNDPLHPELDVSVHLDVVTALLVAKIDTTIKHHASIVVPIEVSDITRGNVTAFQFNLSYDPSILVATGYSTDGTLGEGFGMSINIDTPGRVSVAAAGVEPLVGGGTLLLLEFAATSTDVGHTLIAFEDALLNEGYPPLTTVDGSVTVEPNYGDASLNGSISALDATLVLRHVAEMETLSGAAWANAEVSGNGDVTALDASLILQYVVGLIDHFPAEGTAKQLVAENVQAILKWGEATFDEQTGEVEIPLYLEATSGPVTAVKVQVPFDPALVTIEDVQIHAPESWLSIDRVGEEDLTIVMAGPEPLQSIQVATLRMRLVDPTASVALEGESIINEQVASALEATELRMIPKEFKLGANYPNPFTTVTTIGYQLPEAQHVTLEVYNALGQRVRVLVNQEQEAGFYRITWDGRSDAGTPLSSGLYIYRIHAGDFVQVKKMMIVR